ncbi:MAG TPA: pyridoxal 5'-phosphate synthase, partial [Dermatophilaceae bacterium]|nr:pyridoxal 5'-phosphate synthase [Dermatophilaceae bacterium]
MTDRVDYTGEGLDEADLASTPYAQLTRWIGQAQAEGVRAAESPEGLALQFATVDAAGAPNVRTVLMRFLDPRGPGFVTDAGSIKGREIAANPAVAASLGWPELFRVVRFRGLAEPIEPEALADYFSQRPWGSRVAAWASHQSEQVASRAALLAEFDRYAAQFPDRGNPDDVPVPPSWSGFRIRATEVEFWAGRSSRLHDRIVFTAPPAAELGAGAGQVPLLDDPSAW